MRLWDSCITYKYFSLNTQYLQIIWFKLFFIDAFMISSNSSLHETTAPSDNEILEGFFYHSRYITKSVMNRYGLNINLYTDKPSSKKMFELKTRLKEILKEQSDLNVNSKQELQNLLGSNFSWVCIA